MRILFLIALTFSITLTAQTDCACCGPEHGEFDFWVGEWTVETADGSDAGLNTISKWEDNCIVLERWTGGSGTTGTSINYYDPSDKTWNQLWVDNRNNILELKGGLEDGKMVLKSAVIPGNPAYYNQITWTPNEDGTVTQVWETYDEYGQLLQNLFTGIYKKTPESP